VPLVPTGERDQRDPERPAQLFRCAPGRGCQTPEAISERCAQADARAAIDEARGVGAAERYTETLRPGSEIRIETVDDVIVTGRYVARQDRTHVLVDLGRGEVHSMHDDDIVLPKEFRPADVDEFLSLWDNEFRDCSLGAVADALEGLMNAPAAEFLAAARRAFEAHRAERQADRPTFTHEELKAVVDRVGEE
jgi:hypothetical protein